MTIQYKIYYDGKAATQEKLDEIEEIVVEQEIGKVWEARLKIPVAVSNKGVWQGETDAARKEATRVRIEVRIGKGKFEPLIDGRIVGQDMERSSIPGKSLITLVVHDDSALLHLEDKAELYANAVDSEIARDIFGAAKLGGKPEIDDTPARPDTARPILQQGTKMQILRSLAARHGNFYAYVLPGKEVGESIGCFKKLPETLDKTLPELKMFGTDRNLAEFNVRQNANVSSDIEATSLSLRDKSVVTHVSKFRNATLLDKEAATDFSAENQPKRRLPPGHSDTTNLEDAAKGKMEKSSFTLEADGSVLPLRFTSILSPYRVVKVCLSESRFSTNYVIFKVTHTLNRSNYTQSFSMKGNAVSAKPSASLPQASASASANINAQAGVF